ncbi:hypothetical protein ACIBCM_13720 [Streptomyces sp. NPDC051018]|uniref:hypothetical protein n=1 Tax=Streptomyces sp. NPDC051018 TaxID=3365639 RepID=UPI00379B0C14
MADRSEGPQEEDPQLAVGALVFDIRRKSLGVVMDTEWDRLYLRPPGGGIEWDASRADLRPATVMDRIRPALAELNEHSSSGSTTWE